MGRKKEVIVEDETPVEESEYEQATDMTDVEITTLENGDFEVAKPVCGCSHTVIANGFCPHGN